ncbi:MAG: malonyl-ACP O-methyltransferase BioC [Oxalobacter sp.]|nr:malonyl-ACP O-methyltransferase BioC [Oxalobacter sp.]
MIDKAVVCGAFSKAASSYDAIALFQRQVNERMLCLLPERLPTGFHPDHILDAGCGTGLGIQCLKTFWPDADIIGCDISPAMVETTRRKQFKAVVGDIENLPFDEAAFNLVWSSLSLQWCSAELAFRELHRVTAPDGMVFFSTLAPGTLKEIAVAFSGLDNADHTLDFSTKNELEALLAKTGFKDILLQQETLQVFYPDIRSVMASIRGIGAGNVRKRRNALLGKNAWQTIQERYESFREEAGLPVTYEVVIGSASRWHAQRAATAALP